MERRFNDALLTIMKYVDVRGKTRRVSVEGVDPPT